MDELLRFMFMFALFLAICYASGYGERP